MLKIITSFSMLLGLAAAAPSNSPPVVVELFTSQGCSSCPPADRLLAELSRSPGVIVISRPVTYWDRLGWKDTLARPANTQRQYAYATRFKRAGVYTPQAVVDGRFQAIGSDRNDLTALIASARSEPQVFDIALSANQRAVTIKPATTRLANVDLLWVRSSTQVRIGNGENGGRAVAYTNVVVDENRLGTTIGAPTRFQIPQPPAHADRAILVVQEPGPGRIHAATQWSLTTG